MFNSEDMTISLVVAEKKIEEIKQEHKQEYGKLSAEYAEFINKTKESVGNIGELESQILGFKYPIGYDTGLKINGVKVYSGDEIMVLCIDPSLSGKVGVAITHNGKPYWKSNSDCGYFNDSFEYEFVNHFVHYKNGQEIAKGRKGHGGFIVNLHSR